MDTMTRDRATTMELVNELIDRMNTTVSYYDFALETGGRKYLRVTACFNGGNRLVHMFVGCADGIWGDLYKAASWNKPALNGARFNIFDDGLDEVMARFDPYGGYLYKR
jgi:hypothetical protein